MIQALRRLPSHLIATAPRMDAIEELVYVNDSAFARLTLTSFSCNNALKLQGKKTTGEQRRASRIALSRRSPLSRRFHELTFPEPIPLLILG